MTASRKEYMTDLLDDIGQVMDDFEGYEYDRGDHRCTYHRCTYHSRRNQRPTQDPARQAATKKRK